MDKKFFTDIFREWKSGKCTTQLLKVCKTIASDNEFIKHRQLYHTIKNEERFQEAFQKMSKELFKYGVKLEYVLVLIAFSLSLDMDMLQVCKDGWYNTDILIELLCMVLRKVDFDTSILYHTEWESNCCIFLTIVPLLFFCFNLQ